MWIRLPEKIPDELLDAIVNQLVARQQKLAADQGACTCILCGSVVEDHAGRQRPRTRIADIIKIVAQEYGVSHTDIISQRRTRDVIRPRHLAIYLAHEITGGAATVIGRIFGNRDHTTILHAVRKIRERADRDIAFAAHVEQLRLRCGTPEVNPTEEIKP